MISYRWLVIERVLLISVHGDYQTGSLQHLSRKLTALFDQIQSLPIHLIIDFTQAKETPPPFHEQMQSTYLRHPHIGFVTTVSSATHPIRSFAFSSILRVVNKTYSDFPDVFAAAQFLNTHDHSLPDLVMLLSDTSV